MAISKKVSKKISKKVPTTSGTPKVARASKKVTKSVKSIHLTTNNNAVASFIMGLIGLFIPFIGFILGILAIIFGSIALKQIKITSEKGFGLALAGLILGILSLFMLFIIGAIAYYGVFDMSSFVPPVA